MKTKHILTALALPAMFAACTADDIVSENNGMQKMPERALLSEDFVLNINKGVESRYQVTGTTGLEFEFEANDSIGANLIDEPAWNSTTNTWEEDPANWDIVDYVAPALPFVNKGGDDWKSAGRLGEGNYLFTNPYNPKDGGRLAAKVELPRVVQYSSEKPNAVIEQYNKAVAADVIYDGDMSATISLKNIYAYPKVRIHFANTEDVSKVTKVVLATVKDGEGENAGKKVEGDGFLFRTGLDHKYIAYMFAPTTIEAWLANPANKEKTEADYWAEKHTSHFILDGLDGVNKETGVQTAYNVDVATAPLNKFGKAERTPYLIYEMSESVVSYGKSKGIEVRLMLPSTDNFNTYNVIAYVCTDNGNYKFDFNGSSEGDIKFNDNTIPAKKKNALLRNTSNTLNTVAMTTTSHGTTASMDFGNVVSNVEDWNSLVAKYGDLEKYNGKVADHTPLAVSILNDEFTFTEEAEMPEVAIFTIDKPVNVEGNVTLKNVRVSSTVEVKADATLTTAPTFTATKVVVEEEGNLVFTAQVDEKTKKLVEYVGVTNVENEGTVTVPAGVIAKFNLANGETGVLNVGAAAARAAAEAKAVLNGGSNAGIINNNGVIDVTAVFTNNAPSEEDKNKDEEAEYGYVFIPTVQNNGTFNSKAVTTNNGLFVNAGTLTSNFNTGNAFNNAKILEVKESATTYIDTNSGAQIYFEKKSTTSFTIYDHNENADYSDAERGEIILKVSGKSNKIDLSSSPVNVLIVDGDLEIEKTFTYTTTGTTPQTVVEGLKEVKFIGDGTLKIPAYTLAADDTKVYTAKVNKLTVAEGVTVTISGEINAITDKGDTDNNGIYIANDAVLDIPAEAKLTINYASLGFASAVATEKEAGKINVGGTLVLPDKNGHKDTGVIATVPSTNINLAKEGLLLGTKFDSSAPTASDTAVRGVLKPLISAWVRYTSVADLTNETENTWAGVTVAKLAACPWTIADNAWKSNAGSSKTFTFAADFVKAYNALTTATTDDITVEGISAWMGKTENKTNIEAVIATIKSEADAALAANIAVALNGNAWTDNVYTQLTSSQTKKEIYKNNGDKDAVADKMLTEFDEEIENLTNSPLETIPVGKLDNASYLSLKDKMAASTWKVAESSASYLPDYSYIPVYSTSDQYAVVKAYADMLANEYVQTVKPATAVATSFADVAKYLSELYAAAAKEDAEYYFDKAVTAAVTTTVLDNAQTYKAYKPEQFQALVVTMEGIEEVDLDTFIRNN